MNPQLLQHSPISSSSSLCRDFQPNQFNALRCKNCFKLKTNHPGLLVDTLSEKRPKRAGYLYISSESPDFSSTPTLKSQRWVKRWITLYDDGELHFSIDQHPDTIAQGIVDLKQCVSFKYLDDQCGNFNCVELNINDENSNNKTFFFKSDCASEMKRWYEIISMFNDKISNAQLVNHFPEPSFNQRLTLIRIESPSKNGKFHFSNVSNRNNNSPTVRSDNSIICGTPRSVKNRKNSRNRNDPRSRTCGDFSFDSKDLDDTKFSHRVCINNGTASLDDLSKLDNSISVKYTQGFNLGRYVVKSDDQQPTYNPLRKGWLKLKSRPGNEWSKYWVVLSGVSIMFFDGVQAEDEGNCTITIDLSQCRNVLPVTVTKNYGIELRLKNSRYTLSAMTPGIRDSWINAIKHVLHTLASTGDIQAVPNEESFSCQNGKRIAYVTPESHNWFTTTTDDSCSTTDDETLSLRSGSNLNDNEGIIFGSNENLHMSDQDSDEESGDRETESRRRSVSPTCRRSPVSRVKERNSRRKQRRRSGTEVDSTNMTSSNDALSPIVINRITTSAKSMKPLADNCHKDASTILSTVSDQANGENYANEKKKIEVLESQLEMVKRELKQTKDYLQNNNEENRRLLKALSEQPNLNTTCGSQSALNQNGFDAAKLNRLRRTLYEAEKDVLCKQAEIETLQRTFLSDLDQDGPRRRCSLLARDRSCSSLSQNWRESFASFPPRKLASDMALNVSSKNDVSFANVNSIFRSRRLNSMNTNRTAIIQNNNDSNRVEQNVRESKLIERRCLFLLVREEIDFMKQLWHGSSIENQREVLDFRAQISSLEEKLSDLNRKKSDCGCDDPDFEEIFKSLTELREYFIDNRQKSPEICDDRLSQIVNSNKLNSIIDNYDEFLDKNMLFAQLDRANLTRFKKFIEGESLAYQKPNVLIFLLIREVAFCKLELLSALKSQDFNQLLVENNIFDRHFDASFLLKSVINPEKFNQMSLIAILKSRYLEYRHLKSKIDRIFSSKNGGTFIENESFHKLRDLFNESSLHAANDAITNSNDNRTNDINDNNTKFKNTSKRLTYLLSRFDFVESSNFADENVDFENSIQSCIWEILYIDLNPEVFRSMVKTYFDSKNEKNEVGNGHTDRQQTQSLEAKFETERRKLQAACNDEIRVLKDSYESKLSDKEKELQEEKNRRKKLTKDMLAMKTLNDDSLQAILKNQTDLISELKKKHLKEISRISNEYEQKLFEEKEATKFALDALQKAHELEMSNQMIKLRLQHQQLSSSPHNDSELASFEMCAEKKHYKKIQNAVERENEEISRLTMAYSTKCIEITMLEDHLAEYRSILDKKFSECDSEEIAGVLQSLIADINELDKNLACRLDASAYNATTSLTVENGNVLQNFTPENGRNVKNAEEDHSFDHQNQVTPTKRNVPMRRHSERYHSTPNIRREIDCRSMMTVYPEILEEIKSTGAAPVSERRKYFEHLK